METCQRASKSGAMESIDICSFPSTVKMVSMHMAESLRGKIEEPADGRAEVLLPIDHGIQAHHATNSFAIRYIFRHTRH